MDAALREIQWLKRIMKELSDERETAMPDPKEDEAEEDDSELDRLLRHAMLLLRRKTRNQQFNSSMEDTAEPTDEEEDDELLQRAVTLLRGRREESDAESEQEDEELDRLLRRAMELFAERRRRWLSIGEKDNGTDLDVKTIKAATGSVSPGSTGSTDDEDEEDDELDNLLHRAMYLLRQRLREPSIVDEPIIDTEDVSDVCPLGWRKALRLQHLKENKKRPRDVTVSDERNNKRARCLIELQVDDEDELAETQTNESNYTKKCNVL
ncbi:hypothetical protein PHMEG_00036923 [Phytophthora megakarya]|uniref:Uncharacterized protein n=1 Tax=Phytophthora megakarya TaxID=4795 RepID=A0A225UKV0_9STRA|nr:hypothetical protein PHMEG_00036923 [Phytophthora megakarya]